jgi:hypothetical protein
MKYYIMLLLALSVNLAPAQELAAPLPELDWRMVGSWKGEEKDQQEKGLEKHWIQHRFEDGTYIILFTMVQHGKVSTSAEKGKWWIENGQFYEQHGASETIDVYNYKFLDDLHVKFNMVSGGEDFDNPDYQFIDIKIEEDSF